MMIDKHKQRAFISVANIIFISLLLVIFRFYLVIGTPYFMASIPIYLLILFIASIPILPAIIYKDKLFIFMGVIILSFTIPFTILGHYTYNVSNYILLISVLFFPLLLKLSFYEFSEKQKKIIFTSTVLVVVVTAFTTIMGLELYPTATRMYAIGGEETLSSGANSSELISLYRRIGIGDYSIIYSLGVLFPVFIYLFKISKSRKMRILYIVFSIVIFYSVFKASIVMILIAVFISTVLMFFTKKIKHSIVFLIISYFLSVIIMKPLLIDFLQFISNTFSETNIVAFKAETIKKSLLYGASEGGLDTRGNLYMLSLKTFLQNPIIGAGGNGDFGGHSILLDFIAQYGLATTIPIIAILYSNYRKLCRILTGYSKFTYQVSFLSFLFILVTKGGATFPYFFSMFYIVPALLIYGQSSMKMDRIN